MQELTQKQENFVNNIFKGLTQRESWIQAGYSSNYALSNVDRNACILAGKTKIKQRLEELRQAAKIPLIANEIERKKILSEISRGKLVDYLTCGPDRDLINVGKESPNQSALQEVTSKTEYDKDGAGEAVVTKVRLHDPVRAIAELNKMERVYEPEGGNTININVDKMVVDARWKLEGALKLLAERLNDATEQEETG